MVAELVVVAAVSISSLLVLVALGRVVVAAAVVLGKDAVEYMGTVLCILFVVVVGSLVVCLCFLVLVRRRGCVRAGSPV